MKQYSVFFHLGDELTLKTCVMKGRAWVDAFGLHVDSLATFGRGPQVRVWDGRTRFTIPAGDILSAEIFRLHGLGRVIRVEHRGGRLFLAVVRLMIGQLAFINFLKTGALQREIAAMVKPSTAATSS